MLDHKTRYLQIAFNADVASVNDILPAIPKSERILIEAGTPFIKREGMAGIRRIAELWEGKIVADLKIADGALGEVEMAESAGATAATALGDAPRETLDLFIKECRGRGLDSMIDMLGADEPMRVLGKLRTPPDVVILHRGRDEETARGKTIQYKHISKIKSKYPILISAAGGVDLREARSAIFNGANIVVVNIVAPEDPWTGMGSNENAAEISGEFLKTIE